MRLQDLEGFSPSLYRHQRSAPARYRRRGSGQDQHRRIRHGLLHRELGLRPHPQPLGPRARPGRLLRRICGGGGRPHVLCRPGHRYRRLRPSAGCLLRRHRPQDLLRPCFALWFDRLWILAGHCRCLSPLSRRSGASLRGHRWARPARLDLHAGSGAQDRAQRARPQGGPDWRTG